VLQQHPKEALLDCARADADVFDDVLVSLSRSLNVHHGAYAVERPRLLDGAAHVGLKIIPVRPVRCGDVVVVADARLELVEPAENVFQKAQEGARLGFEFEWVVLVVLEILVAAHPGSQPLLDVVHALEVRHAVSSWRGGLKYCG